MEIEFLCLTELSRICEETRQKILKLTTLVDQADLDNGVTKLCLLTNDCPCEMLTAGCSILTKLGSECEKFEEQLQSTLDTMFKTQIEAIDWPMQKYYGNC